MCNVAEAVRPGVNYCYNILYVEYTPVAVHRLGSVARARIMLIDPNRVIYNVYNASFFSRPFPPMLLLMHLIPAGMPKTMGHQVPAVCINV